MSDDAPIWPLTWVTVQDGVVTTHEKPPSVSSDWDVAFGPSYTRTAEVTRLADALATVTAERDEARRNAAMLVNDTVQMGLARDQAEAAIAIARAEGAAEGLRMAVRPLEWSDCETVYPDGSGRKVAFGYAPLSQGYTVYESPAEGLHVVSGTTAFAAYHLPDLDAAKAAAQADYVAMIATALIPAPAKPADGPRRASGPIDPENGFATTGAEARWIADTDAGVYDDAPPASDEGGEG